VPTHTTNRKGGLNAPITWVGALHATPPNPLSAGECGSSIQRECFYYKPPSNESGGKTIKINPHAII